MTAWRYWGGLLVLMLPTLAGCTQEKAAQGQTSAITTTPSVSSQSPSPEEQATRAATTAVTEMLRVTDAAKHDPRSKDWEPDIRRYSGDPAALLAVKSVRDYATLGLRQEGNTVVDLNAMETDLASPKGPTVRITGCYDSQSTKVVKVTTGEAIPPATPPKYVWDITVTQYTSERGSPWLVNVLEPRTEQSC
jgi:hypothetical protein